MLAHNLERHTDSVHMSLYAHLFVCHYKAVCICAQVFVFHLSGTFSHDYPYPAPVPRAEQATQRDGRGKASMSDSLTNSRLLTPVLVTLICTQSKHSQKSGQAPPEPTTPH